MVARSERVFDPAHADSLDSGERRQCMPVRAIQAAARLSVGIRVADIGSGAGYCSLAILEAPTAPVAIYSIDLSEEMNAILYKRLSSHPERGRVHIQQGRAEGWPAV